MPVDYFKKRHEEHIKFMEGENKSILDRYVSFEEEQITVDWQRIKEDHQDFLDEASEGVEDKKYNDILSYLEYKEILSYGRKGIFFLISNLGIPLGPYQNFSRYGFTKEEDAREYAKGLSARVLKQVSD